MNFTITTKSQLKNLVAKNHSDLAMAFDCICQQDGLKNDSRIVLLPSEEWKEVGVDTRCTDVIYSEKAGILHMMYVSTCHIKNVQMDEYRVKPNKRVVFDIIPIIGRDEGALDTIYMVLEYPNITGKVNQAFGLKEMDELTHIYGEEAQELIDGFRDCFFERLKTRMGHCG